MNSGVMDAETFQPVVTEWHLGSDWGGACLMFEMGLGWGEGRTGDEVKSIINNEQMCFHTPQSRSVWSIFLLQNGNIKGWVCMFLWGRLCPVQPWPPEAEGKSCLRTPWRPEKRVDLKPQANHSSELITRGLDPLSLPQWYLESRSVRSHQHYLVPSESLL